VRGSTGEARRRGKIKYAKAICDYDPATMSPNPDGIDEEIPFKEGQIIQVCTYMLCTITIKLSSNNLYSFFKVSFI